GRKLGDSSASRPKFLKKGLPGAEFPFRFTDIRPRSRSVGSLPQYLGTGVILRRMPRIPSAIPAVMLALPAALFAQSPDPAQLAQVFTTYQHTNTPGCAVGVDAPGRDTWTAAYGMADLENTVANTPATVFEAGSVR